MKELGYLVAIPVAIGTWYLTVIVAAIVMTTRGLHPDSYGVAPCCVLVIGPILGILAARRTVGYFARLDEKRAAEERARAIEEEWRKQEIKNRKRDAEEHAAAQRTLATRLSNVVNDSIHSAANLSTLLRSAEEKIDLAGKEFEEGVFAPFWDAVEQAANKLANFEATVRQLIQNSQFYSGEAPKLETPAPPFQIGLDTLPDASRTANRLRAVVRRAQKDFHFANIYEQRKTNQLLVAGFSTLGEAIVELGDRLDSSLDRLASVVSISISDLASDITSSHENMTSRLAAELERSRDQAASDSEAQREIESKELEMLDNIQRRRKPFPPGLRDGEF